MKYFEEYVSKFRGDILAGRFRNILFLGPQAIGKTVSARKLQAESSIPILIIEDFNPRRNLPKPTIHVTDGEGRYIHIYCANTISKKIREFFDLIVKAK